jgi:uncharacterized phage protein gp47/JayE
MATDFKPPSEVAQEYLDELATTKDVNVSQTDSDWWIRGQVVGGVVAGVYADQRLIANDAFPQRAREDAVLRFLDLYFASGYIPATQSVGNVSVTGNLGATVPQLTQFLYQPNNNAYQSTATIVLPATGFSGTQASGLVPVQSVAAGQSQNLLAGAPLKLSSPPAGILSAAVVAFGGLADARDQETADQARARIVQRIRQPLSVGRVSDYEQYARAADPSVTSASVVRFPFGLGTVAVYITSGTTNIDAAVDLGEVISVIPSQALIDIVQAFLEINKPVTDCVTVLAPVVQPINVTVLVKYAQGTGATILSGQTLTQDQLVTREVNRAIYKTPVGGRQIAGSGFVLASDIEQTIDVKLSDEAVETGSIPILLDRQVQPLSATGYNYFMQANLVAIPGTIAVSSM